MISLKGDLGSIEDDESCQDWWTKYFASVEAMIEKNKEVRREKSVFQVQHNNTSNNNGNVPNFFEEDFCSQVIATADKSPGIQSTKKIFHFKSSAHAARFVAKLSPKHVSRKKNRFQKTALLKIYPKELEAEPEFEQFKEWLHTFELYRGKKTNDEPEDESRIVGSFKGALKVYKWPLPKDLIDHTIMGFDPQYGFFQGLPSNEPIHVLVRVYIVKANDLHPSDLNGKADPYVVLQLGAKRISDKENYVSKQLNPVFGKYENFDLICFLLVIISISSNNSFQFSNEFFLYIRKKIFFRCFEIEATFPQDSLLTVQILDWDLVGSDDLIGETKIDLENRFYSRHRATCALPRRYDE